MKPNQRSVQFFALIIAMCGFTLQSTWGQNLEAKIYQEWKPDLKLTEEYLKEEKIRFNDELEKMLGSVKLSFSKDKKFKMVVLFPVAQEINGTFRIVKINEKKRIVNLEVTQQTIGESKSELELEFLRYKMRDVTLFKAKNGSPIIMIAQSSNHKTEK